MVVEFWPQRLFYVGAGISLTTLLACLGYLAYDWRKKRSRKLLIMTTKSGEKELG
jgi:hypothetical protein